MNKLQKGFTAIEALLIIVILAIIGGTGYYVWHSKQQTNKTLTSAQSEQVAVKSTGSVKTFADCQKSTGSITQQSSPEVCVTKDGQHFTQSTSSSSSSNSQQFLKIPELGIKITLSSEIEDAYYAIPTKYGPILSVHSLDNTDCKASTELYSDSGVPKYEGVVGISSFMPGDKDEAGGDMAADYPKASLVNGKYYYMTGSQYDCTNGTATDKYQTVKQAFLDAEDTIQKL